MTVLEAIQRSTEFLVRKGVESPRLQTELLLAHVLKLPRMQLYLNFERALTSAETENMRELIVRRGQREPSQHIMGSTCFCGLEFTVNRDVLVPRPETELLAEQGWVFLQELAQAAAGNGKDLRPLTALDFGTGSGCLAVTLAKNCSSVRICAVDVSAAALEVARENATRLGVGERVDFRNGDGFSALPQESRFVLIISNPPYIPSNEIETLQPEVRDFDPRAALDGGAEGMEFYRILAEQAAHFLESRGKLMVEFGDGQGERIRKLFESQKWIVEAILDDYNHKPRILIARRDQVSREACSE